MSRFALRDYQAEAYEETRATWLRLHRSGVVPRILLVSRTGTGKTVISGHFMEQALRRAGHRCLFLVRDRALLDQTSRHLDALGLPHGVWAAGHRRVDKGAPIQIASIQTLVAREECPDNIDVVVADEAHQATCTTSRTVIVAYPKATILGLTATPQRSDGTALGGKDGIFNGLVVVKRSYAQLVADEALVPFRLIAPSAPTKELSRDPIDVLRAYGRAKWPDGRPRMRKTVFFCRDRAHAKDVAEKARAAGFRVAAVDGVTKSSGRDLQRLALPDSDPDALDGVASVDLIKQGFDCPPIELLIIACGYGSWTPWMQSLGRGLRPIPPELRHLFGKLRCLIFDLRGSVYVPDKSGEPLGLPSDDREFDIERGSKPKPGAMPLRQCKGCGVVERWAPVCSGCGRRGEPMPAVRVRPRDMAEVKKVDNSFGAQVAFFRGMKARAQRLGKGPGMAFAAFKDRFKASPSAAVVEAAK